MDLSTVQDKLCKGDYENSSYFLKDMNLIFNNAKDYNQTRSQVRSERVGGCLYVPSQPV